MSEQHPIEKEFRKMEQPQGCPGSYSLHAYCDHENPAHEYGEFPHEPDGMVQTESQAKRELKRRGWVFHPDNTATCPKCVRALKSLKG